GCMLFQMIAGHPPFDDNTLMDVLIGHLSAPIPVLVSIHGPVPDSVTAIVHKAMAKVVAERYQSAGEMEQELQKAMSALVAEGVS
ncbi:MAG TPA: serine/threonine protein kinase, partial [Vicinamibacteria bacterium]|nr:serine/threonine protein kinase [Vicinamibacteria bacterium]